MTKIPTYTDDRGLYRNFREKLNFLKLFTVEPT